LLIVDAKIVSICLFILPPGEFLYEEFHQQRNIPSCVPEAAGSRWKDVEAEIKVVAKMPCRKRICARFRLVAATSRTSTQLSLRAPNLFELLLLQNAQQFCLHSRWDIADLVEEEVPLSASSETADLTSDRSGECTPFMAEEFAFQQPSGIRRTIELHEVPGFSLAESVDRMRNQLLACAAFRPRAHRRIRRGYCLHVSQHALQRLTRAIIPSNARGMDSRCGRMKHRSLGRTSSNRPISFGAPLFGLRLLGPILLAKKTGDYKQLKPFSSSLLIFASSDYFGSAASDPRRSLRFPLAQLGRLPACVHVMPRPWRLGCPD